MLGSRAIGNAPLEQLTYLEASITPIHGGPGVSYAALFPSPAKDEALLFLIYMFLSHFCCLICSAHLFMENLDSWDPLGMYLVREGSR